MASIFTKILLGEIKGKIVYQDDQCAAIADIMPQSPTHILIFPKKEIPALSWADLSDEKLLGHLLLTAAKVAQQEGISEDGYRIVINNGKNGGQSVDHVHVHLLGGRPMEWPPG